MTFENGSSSNSSDQPEIDLVGGPFSVVESDPGVFTTLIRNLGIKGVEVDEVYDIQPWGLDPLKPKGLILCFNWKHDKHHPRDFLDPAAKDVWFANQLIDDACASLAILNVLFNCPGVELGEELETFKLETSDMSPKMKGLAISNSRLLRETQNSLARPADKWGSLSATAESTRDLFPIFFETPGSPAKKKAKTDTKRRKQALTYSPRKKKSSSSSTPNDAIPETYHFIGYVPARGKVWELDGLKTGPLEVGELPNNQDPDNTEGWEDVVRPALRLKMQRYGAFGGGTGGRANGGVVENIQFNLLALVQDRYEVKSDELELLKRERVALESRLEEHYGDSWRHTVDEDLLLAPTSVFTTLASPSSIASFKPSSRIFAKDFGARWNTRKLHILNLQPSELEEAWERYVSSAMPVKIAIDEEVQREFGVRTEREKRTHDYAPFIREFLTSLHNEGLLAQYLRNGIGKG